MDGFVESLPTRGAWIEIIASFRINHAAVQSLPTRGAWIEMLARAITEG